MDKQECIDTLTQRRDYLETRIEGKTKVGWQIEWDVREKDALAWALEKLNAEP
jgi:hypothetical protein